MESDSGNGTDAQYLPAGMNAGIVGWYVIPLTCLDIV